jgi:fatty acid desaturase
VNSALGHRLEYQTLAVLLACYGVWTVSLLVLPDTAGIGVAMAGIAVSAALHSSLQHEVIHGHPTRYRWLNTLLIFPSLSVAIPFVRFRDTHLAHHRDARLTDPYDDPESNYLAPEVWNRLSRPARVVLRLNNTLLGRFVIGPGLGQVLFMRNDLRLIRTGDRSVLLAWLWHFVAVAPVIVLAVMSPLPFWAFGAATYGALGVLKIRTFLEHQAHESVCARTVIIEDTGPLAFLFLNNNLHAVHHMHPQVAWYRLPALYQSRKVRFLAHNRGYVYTSYLSVIGRHLLWAKDPVPHPLPRKRD